jgi:hypothetical protein
MSLITIIIIPAMYSVSGQSRAVCAGFGGKNWQVWAVEASIEDFSPE